LALPRGDFRLTPLAVTAHFLLPFMVSAGQPSNHLAYQFLFFSLFHVEHFWLGSGLPPRMFHVKQEQNAKQIPNPLWNKTG
jgi:hypothetical protein